MPTYEYKCASCGHGFEQFQSIKAKPIRQCPICRKAAVKRLVGTGAGIIFKGTGFYQTDYRSDTYKKAAEGDKGTSPKSSSSNDKPTPDTKAPSVKKSIPSSKTCPTG